MDTKALTLQLNENAKAIPDVLKAIEGLSHQLEQGDLLALTIFEVRELLADYVERVRLQNLLKEQIEAVIRTTEQLIDHGYPKLPEREISQAAFDDLNQNRETIEFAQSKFHIPAVTTKGKFVPSKETGVL